MFEDTKWVIGSHKSIERQYNGQNKKDKQWSTNITQKTED